MTTLKLSWLAIWSWLTRITLTPIDSSAVVRLASEILASMPSWTLAPWHSTSTTCVPSGEVMRMSAMQ